MARKFKILVRRKDNKFQKYIVTDRTLKKNYVKSSLTKSDRAEFKQLKRKRVFYQRKPPEYKKWVALEMGVKSRDRSLTVWFGFTKDISDVEAYEKAIKRVEHINEKEVTKARIEKAMMEEIGWLDASDGFVYNTFIQPERPDRSNFFVYDAKSGKKLVYDGRFKNWNFRK